MGEVRGLMGRDMLAFPYTLMQPRPKNPKDNSKSPSDMQSCLLALSRVHTHRLKQLTLNLALTPNGNQF